MRSAGVRAPWRSITVAVIAFLIGSATIVVATGIPGPDGRIQGCYNQQNGNLRVVTSASECRNSEIAISWNQTGPAGASGATGPAGASGATGTAGPSGPAGPSGATGLTGATGPSGATGPTGASGPSGATGHSGATGPTGASGVPGTTLASVGQLAGLTCTFNGANGTTVVSFDASGRATLTCATGSTPNPTPQPDPDDADGDGVANAVDNCAGVANADQSDRDLDGLGDVCDPTPDGQSPAQLAIAPTAYTFGNVLVGTTATSGPLTVTNTGGSTTGPLSITFSSPAFSISGSSCAGFVLGPGANCTIIVRFTPVTGGVVTGTATIAESFGGSVVANLTGTGLMPAITHQNGFGGTYLYAAPLGVPGNPATYSLSMATAAAASTTPGLTLSVNCGDGSAAMVRLVRLVGGEPVSSSWFWMFTGPAAGHASFASEGEGSCPTVGDPIWN